MRLRHKSRSTRHLHAPYHHGPGRKRGGRVHPGLKGEGERGGERHDRSHRRASGGGNWIAGAIKHKGGLHRALHVPEGTKIPAKKMAKAAKSKNPRIRKMVGLARTLSHMHHG